MELISVIEAAELIGISHTSVHYAIRKGYISARKVGRGYVVDLQSVMDYAANRNRNGGRQKVESE